jgi:hypothetical protein
VTSCAERDAGRGRSGPGFTASGRRAAGWSWGTGGVGVGSPTGAGVELAAAGVLALAAAATETLGSRAGGWAGPGRWAGG